MDDNEYWHDSSKWPVAAGLTNPPSDPCARTEAAQLDFELRHSAVAFAVDHLRGNGFGDPVTLAQKFYDFLRGAATEAPNV